MSQTYNNAKLAQLDKYQTEMAEVPSSILIGDDIVCLFFCFHLVKPLMPIS